MSSRNPVMRIRTAAPLGLLALAVTVTVTGTGPVATAAPHATIGGSRLATRGRVVASGAPALPATVASGWLVADLDTGAILAAQDPHGRFAPASTLKVLTADTVIPTLDPLRQIRPTFDDLNVDGSRVGLVQQMTYSVKDLLTAMLVVSGNDAANAVATAYGGVAKTVAAMNAQAAHLQAFDTHAVNANGLDDPRQLTSPYDLALIGRAAMQEPAFRSYVRTKIYYLPAPGHKTIYLGSHDKLLWNYPGAIGIKNGYTVKAQATFVGAATRSGHTLIVTLLHTAPRYWPEAAALLDWGFRAEKADAQPVGQLVDPVSPTADHPAVAAPAPVRQAAMPEHRSGLPLLPGLFVGSGVAALWGGLMRNRRIRRQGRRKLRLDLPV